MFSLDQKQIIAKEVEKLLLSFNHPEMPKEKVEFTLFIQGKEYWSYANIQPNWIFSERNPPNINLFNEMVADKMKKEK